MNPPTTTKDSIESLDIHVLNAGIGESIVVRLPGDRWGVVDCYSSSLDQPDNNLTWMFLQQHQVKALEFLCLTHPHADHYRGISRLFEEYQPRFFWQFPVPSNKHLIDIFKCLIWDAKLWRDSEGGKSVSDLDKTFQLVSQKIEQEKQNKGDREFFFKMMLDIKPLYPYPFPQEHTSPSISIQSIAPSSVHVHQYYASIEQYLIKNRNIPTSPRPDHNSISAALMIDFGNSRIVLGGDAETSNWRETMASFTNPQISLTADIVKCSHHGSPTGYCNGLWACFASNGRVKAIITPSKLHRLPTREAIKHIRQYTDQIYTTCLSAIPFLNPAIQPADGLSNYTDEVKFALQHTFNSFYAYQPEQLGICSVHCDNTGNCQVTCSGQAGILTLT